MQKPALFILLILSSTQFSIAQQKQYIFEKIILQHWENSFFVNPAAIGTENKRKINLAGTAMSRPIHGNATLSYEHLTKSRINNFAFSVSHYSIDDWPQQYTFSSSYSRTKALHFAEFRFGVQLNYNYINNMHGFGPEYYTRQQFADSRLSAEAGIYLENAKYFAGISIKNLPELSVGNEHLNVKNETILNFHGGYNLPVSQSFVLKPAALMQFGLNGIQRNFHINNSLVYKEKLTAGISFQHEDFSNVNGNFTPELNMAGCNAGIKLFNKWRLNAAAMFRLNKVNGENSLNTLELATAYLF